ncbi:hypothetical protein PVAND_015556 [Polypedilum vanderplanki]|uniref:MYND-type domain-containing protein n=1 Tax=Polypedilum vanderplanki TaxID=319348 RepID=A0A9J6BDI0_POLVA|nr:hypothetical protein PVAND_015556 [Polypedilum vanderplanki]
MSNFDDIDKIFTTKCSTKTVQSNDNGFFMNFYLTVINSFKDDQEFKVWLRDCFQKCESESEKLQLLYNDPTISWEILGTLEHVTEIYRKKDSIFSWQKRDQVGKLIKMHDEGNCQIPLDKILILASQAVMRAPMKDVDKTIDNGLTFAFALAQRSEVFLRMHDGQNGLNDLQLAVKYGLDIKKNAEYYSKLAKFYALLNEDKKCEISIKLYHQLIGHDDLRRDILMNEIQLLKSQTKSKSPTKLQPPSLKSHTSESTEIERCTSTLLRLNETTDAGKFFVSNGSIETGETLLVESAKCACLYPKNCGTHCYHCFTRLLAPIGCSSCSSVAFCSINCRDIACNSYHKFECHFFDLLIGSGMSILCHIALKMITMHGTPEKALEAGEKLTKTFCTNSTMRDGEDFFKRCLMASFLLRCLQQSQFFGRRTTESAEPTPIELKIGALIFNYLQSLQFNAHEIYETVTVGHAFLKSKINYIGVGIYEVGAMFNHECYPSVMRWFNGTTLIFNSIRPHVDGEVVAENYGPIFTKQTKVERQRNLASRYWFKCKCRACEENWPVLDKLNNKCRLKCVTEGCDGIFNYQNGGKNSKCAKCKKNVSLQMSLSVLNEAEEKFKKGAEAMDIENIEAAINAFITGIEMFHKVAVPPHKDLHIAQESLRACIAASGNVFNAGILK